MTQVLERNFQYHADRVAIIDSYRQVTWRQFFERTAQLAAAVRELGVRQGERAIIVSNDRIEVLELYFALARAGVVFAPINRSINGEELAYTLHNVRPSLVFATAELLSKLDFGDVPAFAVDTDDFARLGVSAPSRPLLPAVPEDTPAAIFHTSATTGRSKGVVVDQASFRAIALGWLSEVGRDEHMVLLNCCPLFHGSSVLSLTYMTQGATVVLMGNFSPQAALALSAKHQATHIWLVPQMLRFILKSKALDSTDLSSVREILYGAAPMPRALLAEAARRISCGFRQVYGITEAGGPFMTLGPDEHAALAEDAAAIPVGKVIPGMSIGFLDEEGVNFAPGSSGQICVRGPGVMHGYRNNPEATAEVFANGWLLSGDIGSIDHDGLVTLIDRVKDVVLRAGQNIYPREIEDVLHAHAEVADAAVIGIPDDEYGEVPVAYVVPVAPVSNAEEFILGLRKHLAAHLTPYKTPADIVLLEVMPRNPSGKILKKALRLDYAERSN